MEQHREITFETEETVVLREGAQVSVGTCSGCGQQVFMATPQAAAFLLGLRERHIFRLLEAGRVHFTENVRVLVCLESVRFLRKISSNNYDGAQARIVFWGVTGDAFAEEEPEEVSSVTVSRAVH